MHLIDNAGLNVQIPLKTLKGEEFVCPSFPCSPAQSYLLNSNEILHCFRVFKWIEGRIFAEEKYDETLLFQVSFFKIFHFEKFNFNFIIIWI
jgi:hypothetical protein